MIKTCLYMLTSSFEILKLCDCVLMDKALTNVLPYPYPV